MSPTGLPENESNQKPICEPKPQTDRDKLVQLGWRQGSALPPELVAHLVAARHLPADLSPTTLILVTGHDCDLINGNFEAEPFAEIVRFRVAERPDGNLTFGKNPRKLQIEIADVTYEAGIWDRSTIPRESLLRAGPMKLDAGKRQIREIARWISKRYIRAAFPNAFEDRAAGAQRKIKDILRPVSKLISGIYLLLDEEELPAEVPYDVSIIATMPITLHGNPILRAEVDAAIIKMADLLNRTPGLQVTEPEVISERELSIVSLETLKRWDYDSLSSREEPPEPMTPSAPI